MKPRGKINIKKRVLGLIFVLALIGWLMIQPIYFEFHGTTMGTTYRIKGYRKLWHDQKEIKKKTDQLLRTINQSMSTYDPNSTISKFNRSKIGQITKIDPLFYQVLSAVQPIYEQSQGAFDPTIWPLYELWGFGTAKKRINEPTKKEIQSIQKQVGFHKVTFTKTQLMKKNNIQIDLSAIAKGFGVDQIATQLEQMKITSYFIDIGGEVRVGKQKPGKKNWVIGITHPDPSQAIIKTLSLTQKSVATSGSYRNYQLINNKKRPHIINPKTGYPVDHQIISVTVITDSCIKADALATTLMVLNDQEGKQLMTKYPEAKAIWFLKKGSKWIEK